MSGKAPTAIVDRYRWMAANVDAATVLCELRLSDPDEHAPSGVWIAWHEIQAECWALLAARDGMFDWHDQFIGGDHREKALLLKRNPADRVGRRGHWSEDVS
jgi:hypothetical protein